MTEAILVKAPESHDAWKLKGDLHLSAKGGMDDALAAYRKSVEIKPDFFAAQAALATLLIQQGNVADATLQVEGMQKTAANHPRTHFLQAQLAFQKKDFKLARGLVQQVLKATPANIQGLQLAGAVELQFGAWPQAQAYLSKALEAAPQLTLARRLLVVAYLRGGQPAKAMEILLPGLERAKVDPGLLSVAGEVYLQNGDVKKAEDYFKRASLQSPKDAKKKTALALVHLVSGPPEAAFDELQGIALSDTGTSADLALISAHLRRQEFDKALIAIDRLEKKQPTDPLASQLRARTLLAKKDTVGARKSLLRALEIDPTYFPAAANLAGLDLEDKKPEVAKSRFDAVLSKDPKNVQALLALAELAARSGASNAEVAKLIGNAVAANPTDSATRLLLIDFYLRNKDVKGAASAAQDAAAVLPDSPRVLNALGRTQQASGDYNQAAATFTKLVAMQPLSPLPLLHLTDAYMADGNKSGATASLRKALTLKPDLLEAQRALITLDLAQSRYDDALVTARTVQKQRPKEAAGYALEGDIKLAQNNMEGAITAYREGLKLVNSSELALKLHSVFLTTGKTAEADRLSMNWQKDNPKDAAFLFYLGDIALGRSDYIGAEKHYAAVVKLQSDSAIAYNNLAWVSAKLNKDGAIGYAERANALAPNQPAFMDTLALLLSEKGDHAKALELQQKALSLQPTNAQFKLNLAKIYLKGGKKDLAKKTLDELAKLGEKFPAQAEVAALLKGS
jgi:putative PEP-CTERM system TPR-repeat lipoprotein